MRVRFGMIEEFLEELELEVELELEDSCGAHPV